MSGCFTIRSEGSLREAAEGSSPPGATQPLGQGQGAGALVVVCCGQVLYCQWTASVLQVYYQCTTSVLPVYLVYNASVQLVQPECTGGYRFLPCVVPLVLCSCCAVRFDAASLDSRTLRDDVSFRRRGESMCPVRVVWRASRHQETHLLVNTVNNAGIHHEFNTRAHFSVIHEHMSTRAPGHTFNST